MSLPIGTERRDRRYIKIKISETEWRLKHVHLWEQHHKRAVPKGQLVCFKDDDPTNFNIENLECLSRAELNKKNSIKPIGSERKHGKFTRVKVSDTEWKLKHIHLWETHHNRAMPKGHNIIFLDRDYTNFAIENLQCISRGEFLHLFPEYKNSVKVGSEHYAGDNEVKIKVAEGIWKTKHIHLWEEFHKTSVPEGHCICFRDRDKTNFAIENLECISYSERAKRHNLGKEIGTERTISTDKDKCTFVKINRNTWKRKHVLIWEEFHKQPVPKGHCICFKDNDIFNYHIENLECISQSEMATRRKYGKGKPIGSERVVMQKKDKCSLIKVGHRTWKRKHVQVWEEHHRTAVPPNHIIMFKDNDPTNCSIENLECVSNKKILSKAYGANNRPIGTERLCGKYTLIKTEASIWKGKHIHIWEEHHKCPVPDGCTIRFRDNDYTNFAIENLQCVMSEKQSLKFKYAELIPLVKVANNKWRRKHVLIWEKHHKKPVPKGYTVIFLDRDYTNFAIENLECVPLGVFNSVQNRKLISPYTEMTRAHLLITHMKSIVKRKNKLFKPKI